jgi:hypothetical protein
VTNICLVNKSTLATAEEVSVMARACATQLRQHFAPLWGLLPAPVTYLRDEDQAPPGSWVIAVLDDSDQAGALGWHTEEQGDLIYGRVFVRPVLDNGGDVLSKPLSVASVASHEVLETAADPRCNLWADDGRGVAYALEVCDPVESDAYAVVVRGHGRVTVSNFVTPAWFDPNAGTGDRFDWLGRVSSPFAMTEGGYVVVMREGKVDQHYGERYPDWRKETKRADTARAARR